MVRNTIAANTGYVVNNVTSGENTIYAKTVDNSDNVSTEAVELKVTRFMLGNMTTSPCWIAPIGITFGELKTEGFAGQNFTSWTFRDGNGTLTTDEYAWYYDCTDGCEILGYSNVGIYPTTIVRANGAYHMH